MSNIQTGLMPLTGTYVQDGLSKSEPAAIVLYVCALLSGVPIQQVIERLLAIPELALHLQATLAPA